VGKTPMGLLLIHKPAGITSFSVLGTYKKYFGTTRIGHTGTLDRFASGLMVVLVGSAARLASYITLADKEYRAEFCFGTTTDTLDPEGRPAGSGSIPDKERVLEAMKDFVGTIEQKPPEFSAVHLQGKRAYQRALAGEIIDMPSRQVCIKEFTLESWQQNKGIFRVSCSKGTYIRSLARDLALSCGTVAHVTALHRLRVGSFKVEDAHIPGSEIPPVLTHGQALVDALDGVRTLRVNNTTALDVLHGRPPDVRWLEVSETGLTYAVINDEGELIGLLDTGSKWGWKAIFSNN